MLNRFFLCFFLLFPITAFAEEARITANEVVSFERTGAFTFSRADDALVSRNELNFKHLDVNGVEDFRFSLIFRPWENQSETFDVYMTQLLAKMCTQNAASCLKEAPVFQDLPGTLEGRYTKLVDPDYREPDVDHPVRFRKGSVGQFRAGPYRVTAMSESNATDSPLFADFLRFLTSVKVIGDRPMPLGPDTLTEANCPLKVQEFREKYCSFLETGKQESCKNESGSMKSACELSYSVDLMLIEKDLNKAKAICHLSVEPCN